MQLLIVFIGCLFLLFDVALLKKKAADIYERIFYFPVWETAVGAALLFLAAMASGDKGTAILKVMFFVVFGIYLLRRREFFEQVKTLPAPEPRDEKLELALATFPIVGYWALGMFAAAVVIELIMTALVVELILAGISQGSDELVKALMLSEISVAILLILIYRAVRKQKSLRFTEVLGLETRGIGFVKLWLLPALFAFLYAIGSSMFLESRPIQPMTPLQELLDSTQSMAVLLFFVATAVLTAPFFEEVIFRGFLFYVLRPFKGVVFAVIFVALLFGVLHVDQYWGDGWAIAVVGFFGLALTLLRAWTGSAVPGIVAHYVYNISLIVVPVVMIIFSNPIYFDYQMNFYRLNSEQKEEKLLASIAQNPKFPDSYNDLAWLYSEQGIKLDEALKLVDQALNIQPRNYAFMDTKAEVLFKMGRIREAIEIEEDLIKKYPNDPYLQGQLKKFKASMVDI